MRPTVEAPSGSAARDGVRDETTAGGPPRKQEAVRTAAGGKPGTADELESDKFWGGWADRWPRGVGCPPSVGLGCTPMPLLLETLRSIPTVMGRLEPLRLPDVGLGALTRWCPPELVNRAREKCGRRELRRRLLPTRTVVYFELARCLFPGEGYASVYEHLLPPDQEPDPYVARRGFRVPDKSSLREARRRLGAPVMEEVFRQVAGPVADVATCPAAFWRGLRLEAFDGRAARCGQGAVKVA